MIFFFESKRGSAWLPRDEDEFKLGSEQITSELVRHMVHKDGAHVGLLTHFNPMTERGSSYLENLKERGICLTKLFVPSATDQALLQTFDYSIDHDCWQQANSESLQQVQSEAFKDEFLDETDLLAIDLQDLGVSYHAYVHLVITALQTAARLDKPVVILDRPNLLGNKVEGPIKQDGLVHGLPLRHGMTIGELAQFCNQYLLQRPAHLKVITMQHYHRARLDESDVSQELSDGYSLCGLLEHAMPIDVGIGTSHAYASVLLPDVVKFPERCWYQLQVMLAHTGIKSSRYRYYSKGKKAWCRGLKLKFDDADEVDSFAVALAMLDFFKKHGVQLTFSDAFDRQVGTSKVREYVQGKISKAELCQIINKDLEHFYRRAFGSFMYHPLPQVVPL